MRILGIDPGLSITGFGLIETGGTKPLLLEAGCLKNSAALQLEKRLLELYRGITEVIAGGKPESVAVEALFSNYKHPGSALQMAHARGVLFLAAAQAGLPVFAYEPARVKKSLTGRGAATKSQMQHMIQSLFDLEEPPSPPDVADAIAVALCHASMVTKGHLRGRRGRQDIGEELRNLLESGSGRQSRQSELDRILEKVLKTK